MAKPRQARLTADEIGQLPHLDDESPNLWSKDLSDVARSLLSAAVRCFASNGFHGTTTRDIPHLVGLSPAALYVHFPSKEGLLFEIIRTSHESVLAYVTGPEVSARQEADTRLATLVARYTEWHARHYVAARVSQYDLAALSAEHYDAILAMRRETNRVFRKVVNHGVVEGVFKDVDVARVSRAMLSLGIDLVRWYRPDGPDSPEKLGTFNAQLALGMVT